MTDIPTVNVNMDGTPDEDSCTATIADTSLDSEHTKAIADITVKLLEDYGGKAGATVGPRHRQLLDSIADAYTTLLDKENPPQRIAIPADTGLGKTTSIVALAVYICKEGLNISLGVCQEQVAALIELKRDMIAAGVPANEIGLYHRKHGASDSGNSQEEVQSRKIALVCHNRIYKNAATDSLEEFYFKYGDTKRDLFIWDESLLKSEGAGVPISVLRTALFSFNEVMERTISKENWHDTPFSLLLDHTKACFNLLDSNKCPMGEVIDWTSTIPDGVALDELHYAFESLSDESFYHELDHKKEVGRLLAVSLLNESTAVPITAGGDSLLKYKITIPDCLDRVVILDASASIRGLVKADSSITVIGNKVKDYSDVTVHYWQHAAGRESITSNIKTSDSTILAEVSHIVSQIPSGEDVLLFTHKQRNNCPDIPGKLREAMVATGGNRNIDVLTWGKHTNINTFVDVKHVIIVGIMRRRKADLAALAYGQGCESVDNRKLNELEVEELAHLVYQASMRGHGRRTYSDKAGQMNIWVFDNQVTNILDVLAEHEVNMTRKLYSPSHMSGKGLAVVYQWLVSSLSKVPEEKISMRKLKTLHPFQHYSQGQVKRYLKEIPLVLTETGNWHKNGRSWERY